MTGWLLDAGANPHGPGDLEFDYVTYPVHVALKNNKLPLVLLLIEQGADLLVETPQQENALTIVTDLEDDLDEELVVYVRSAYEEKDW